MTNKTNSIEEEESIEAELGRRRGLLISARKEKTIQAGEFGRFWSIWAVAMFAVSLLLGLVIVILKNDEQNDKLSLPWGAITDLMLILAIMVAIFVISRRKKVLTRFIGYLSISFAALSYIFHLEGMFHSEGFLVFAIVIIAFPIAIAVGFGPLATSAVRRLFPTAQFPRSYGFITGILWLIGFIAAMVGYCDCLKGNSSEKIILLIASGVLWCISTGITVYCSRIISVDRVKKLSRRAVIFGIISLGAHFLLFFVSSIIKIIYDLRYPGNRWFFSWDFSVLLMAVFFFSTGLMITMVLTSCHFVLFVTYRKWFRQVNVEIERLTIELEG